MTPRGDQREGARLIRHSLINVVGRVMIGAVGIILVPIMLNGLGAENYGIWIAALTLCELWASMDLGLGWSLTREVAREPEGTVAARFALSVANALVLLGFLGTIVIAAVGYLLTPSLGISADAQHVAPAVFVILGFAYVGEALIGYLTAVLYGLRQFSRVTALLVGLALARAAGFVVLLMSGLGILWLAVWYAISSWLTGLSGTLALARSHPAFRVRAGHLDLNILRQSAVFSLASQVTALGTTALWKAPTLMLGVMRDAATIVPFHLGQRLPLMVYSLGWQAAEAAFPAASEHEAADNRSQSRQILLIGTRWSVLLALPLLLTICGIAPWFLQLWIGTAIPEVVAIMRVTAGTVLAHLMGATALHVLWGRGRGVQVSMILGGMAAAITLSAWYLVSDFGALGAAWSALVPMLLGSALLVRFAGAQCGTSFREVMAQAFRGLLLPSSLTLLAAILLGQWLGSGGWLHFLATCGAAGLCFVVTFYAFGSEEEERQLLFQVFFGATKDGDDGSSQSRYRKPRWLRVIYDLLVNLRYYFYDATHTQQAYYESLFRSENDPWHYGSMPERGADRFAAALAMLDSVKPDGARFDCALEIGCAEGLFTLNLAPRCNQLLAVDISEIALERARARCNGVREVEFRSWDLLRDPMPSQSYDLVVAMGVLENFVRPKELKALRERLVELVRPDGYLLLESTRTGGDLEDTWWRRAMHRGKWLNQFVAQHPALETIEVRTHVVCVQTLCRKRP